MQNSTPCGLAQEYLETKVCNLVHFWYLLAQKQAYKNLTPLESAEGREWP